MSAAHKLPAAYDETDSGRRAPVVTLIGSNLPTAYLEEAEPSPIMMKASRLWQRLIILSKLAIVIFLVGGYPAAVIASHKINSDPVVLGQIDPWASPEIGTAVTLIGREITGAGWADDRAYWHPAARLTALPAWQEGIIAGLSDYNLLIADYALTPENVPDPDLNAAGRLLAPTSDDAALPRLNAAAEALQRYDGRLSRGLASAPRSSDAFIATLNLYQSWAEDSRHLLSKSALTAEAWPASRGDIEAIYLARARAHVASALLTVTLETNPGLINSRDAAEARDRAIIAWRRAATFNPVFISSQAGTGRILSDHPATMSFYMDEARSATEALMLAVQAGPAPSNTVASNQTKPAP